MTADVVSTGPSPLFFIALALIVIGGIVYLRIHHGAALADLETRLKAHIANAVGKVETGTAQATVALQQRTEPTVSAPPARQPMPPAAQARGYQTIEEMRAAMPMAGALTVPGSAISGGEMVDIYVDRDDLVTAAATQARAIVLDGALVRAGSSPPMYYATQPGSGGVARLPI